MPDTVSYNRNKVHNITMPSELDEAFENSELFDLPEYPRESRDVKYLEELKAKLEAESKKRSKEVVLGVWLRPYGGAGQIAGFGYYERKEAERLTKISKDYEYSVDPFFGFYDMTWFDESIATLKSRP